MIQSSDEHPYVKVAGPCSEPSCTKEGKHYYMKAKIWKCDDHQLQNFKNKPLPKPVNKSPYGKKYFGNKK